MRRMLQMAAWATLWSVMSGCAAAPGGEPALPGTQWSLVSASRGALQAHAAGSGVTLAFDSGRVSGYGGCNTYSGDYTLAGSELRVGTLTRTKRGCEDVAGAVETAWHAALAETLQVTQQASQLTLTTADGLVLRFEPDTGGAREP